MDKIDKRLAIAWLAGHTSAGSECCAGAQKNIASLMATDLKATPEEALEVVKECEELLEQMFENWIDISELFETEEVEEPESTGAIDA